MLFWCIDCNTQNDCRQFNQNTPLLPQSNPELLFNMQKIIIIMNRRSFSTLSNALCNVKCINLVLINEINLDNVHFT